MKSVIVRINPPLKNVRLADLLEAVTKAANPPVRYSIEDYAIIFSLSPPETSQIQTLAETDLRPWMRTYVCRELASPGFRLDLNADGTYQVLLEQEALRRT